MKFWNIFVCEKRINSASEVSEKGMQNSRALLYETFSSTPQEWSICGHHMDSNISTTGRNYCCAKWSIISNSKADGVLISAFCIEYPSTVSTFKFKGIIRVFIHILGVMVPFANLLLNALSHRIETKSKPLALVLVSSTCNVLLQLAEAAVFFLLAKVVWTWESGSSSWSLNRNIPELFLQSSLQWWFASQ